MDMDDGPILRPEGLAVAARLGIDEPPERVRPAGDLPIGRVVRCELQEEPGGRPALVKLAGRVEEARAVASRCRATGRREGLRIPAIRSSTAAEGAMNACTAT
jgi:hypothetical protein